MVKNGLSDRGYPPSGRSAEETHAVEALIESVRSHPGIEIVTLGPLTNLALALRLHPGIAKEISRCVIMGGNPCCEGNVTPAAEYNIWVDPEAAQMVFRSHLPVEMVGWHLCRGDAALDTNDIDRILSLGNPLAQFAIDCNCTAREAYFVQTGQIGISLPDPVAMSIALDPSISIDASDHYVDVEVHSALTRGMTVVDKLNLTGNGRNRETWSEVLKGTCTRVCWAIDIERWKAVLFQALAS